ncbi:biotin--[acetyl-CoA-carboxylase] ligase [Paracidobacterium acidisoli]|uniref:biotin--[biotin carboxyl-carrier protein] ligase n=1 Tax=Paracidobacterium acidisoli TaxID=2303751 RepID=A0A372IMA1_9BACT|nr:biotin--[acetyl-CoA-carboxylase] ligase [Paracidobacterium acidisoli]MBT9332487.1 biotin--[acetyl-CoA-carboxylase] ligase [Paracidobacterium acidisoli]
MDQSGRYSPQSAPATEDGFDLAAADAALAGTPFAGKLRYFPTIHSTNTYAMQQADAGAPEGMVYLADEQTAGRGRGAHAWSSPPGSGLYVSVLLRPRMAPADALWLSLAAGLAVRAAVEEVTSLRADLRWPNDLLLGRRKFCGILTELNAEVTRVRHAVVGIGINVHQEQFPEELRTLATSLCIETGRNWARQDLLLALLQSLQREVSALTSATNHAESILRRLEGASSWIRGRRVRVEEGEGFSGITEGLDARGFLVVRTAEGLRTVYSGGVREDHSATVR